MERADDGGDPDEIEVLEENVDAVAVFTHCQPQYAVGMGGAHYLGVTALEARAAATMLHIPRARFPDVLAGVNSLSRHTAEIRNRQK